MRVAVVGAGWAGMAAAVALTQAGHHVTVMEAARTLGGRARALHTVDAAGQPLVLDNGQHILIGAYTETLRMLRLVGVKPGVLETRRLAFHARLAVLALDEHHVGWVD